MTDGLNGQYAAGKRWARSILAPPPHLPFALLCTA